MLLAIGSDGDGLQRAAAHGIHAALQVARAEQAVAAIDAEGLAQRGTGRALRQAGLLAELAQRARSTAAPQQGDVGYGSRHEAMLPWRPGGLEGNVVVEIGSRAPAPLGSAGRTAGRTLGGRIAAVPRFLGSPATAAPATAHHLHLAGDDFGGVAVIAALVLPLAGTQPALDVHLRTLAQVFRGDLAQAVPEHHGMPFRLFLHFAGLLVAPTFGRGQPDVG